ncbi:conserved hypothetical protein [Shewanella halifaxensis HAW-EB4]|uniref:Uncharacterized protein n=1 Tax=Shewanella halifaxensis (strain HAW-EB4) TaxID=458817 RepID=B0TV21_SHEHH|nr:Bax inhibitor-1 family protein [Shewanella halifaxensis]ABZ78288.1 conserved hypothetical protein [Shewanella halifaxensis HAW-EB4]
MEKSQVGVSHYLSGIFLKDRAVSKSVFNLVIGLVLMWGFTTNYLTVVHFPTEWINSVNPWVILIGFLIFSTLGFLIMFRYRAPLFSFLGYNLVTLSVGLLLKLCLQYFTDSEIVTAIQYTAGITLLMIISATLMPKLFMSFGKVLVVITGWILTIELSWLLMFGHSHELIHWIVAVSMCGYIGYFWAQACKYGETLDEAIDFGGLLYMEIINLFLRLLEILSSKR